MDILILIGWFLVGIIPGILFITWLKDFTVSDILLALFFGAGGPISAGIIFIGWAATLKSGDKVIFKQRIKK